ncbi:cytidine deaminase [Aerococcaceae bacterium DSM 111176]|nr:cytidine deaminase [Aerococcaceae bacterium DSM 111176]
MISEKNKKELIAVAKRNCEKAYAPYSNFPVGAALLLADDTIIDGINIENVSFGATNCAERTAIFTAITQGYQAGDLKAIAVAGDTEDYLPPCSLCRQVMVEFCDGSMPIILTRRNGDSKTVTLDELVPMAFDSMEI